MPISKRNKVVSLTKVKKKGRQAKEELVEKVQDTMPKFKYQYVSPFKHFLMKIRSWESEI